MGNMIATNVGNEFAHDFNAHYRSAEWYLNQPGQEVIHLKMAFQSLEMCCIRVKHYADDEQKADLENKYIVAKKYMTAFETLPTETRTRNFHFYKTKLTDFLSLIAQIAIEKKLFPEKIER